MVGNYLMFICLWRIWFILPYFKLYKLQTHRYHLRNSFTLLYL